MIRCLSGVKPFKHWANQFLARDLHGFCGFSPKESSPYTSRPSRTWCPQILQAKGEGGGTTDPKGLKSLLGLWPEEFALIGAQPKLNTGGRHAVLR